MISRRKLPLALLAGGAARAGSPGGGYITDVDGIRVGHYTLKRRPTGCTVLIFEKGAVAGVDVRGAAPGTRETDLLDPVNTVQQVQAILLTGGSAYGLDAAGGVMRYLEEKGIGFKIGAGVVPIVPAAVLYDLGLGGDWSIRPDQDSGYQACLLAKAGPVEEGCLGAGAGATVGKMFGPASAMKSGIGTASIRIGKTGLVVGALVAVNAVGDIYESGKIIAGARNQKGGGFRNTALSMRNGELVVLTEAAAGGNTTIGVVATNAVFDKAQISKIAKMAHDGLARTINPVHMPSDGDTLFAVATGTSKVKANHGAIGALAADAAAEAVIRAVKSAKGLGGLPSASEI
jgi:L-aminopeptidase/D-esterase-like protein